jgi:hypothetical protein
MQLPKGMEVPEAINPLVYFSLEDFDQAIFDDLTKGIKAMIEKSPEYQHLMAKGRGFDPKTVTAPPKTVTAPSCGSSGFDDLDNDIPF